MQPVIAYESRDRGSLEPGEVILWEGGDDRRGLPRFRITNRRAFNLESEGNPAKHLGTIRWPFGSPIVLLIGRRGSATIQFGSTLWMTGIKNWHSACGSLAAVPHRRRTRHGRKSPTRESKEIPALPEAPVDRAALEYSSITTDLGLLDAEQVLWSGSPVVARPIRWPRVRAKLVVIAWLVVPSAMAYFAVSGKEVDAKTVIFGLISPVWFLIAINLLLVKPIRTRWRLRRTTYVLTSRRAFVLQSGTSGRWIRLPSSTRCRRISAGPPNPMAPAMSMCTARSALSRSPTPNSFTKNWWKRCSPRGRCCQISDGNKPHRFSSRSSMSEKCGRSRPIRQT